MDFTIKMRLLIECKIVTHVTMNSVVLCIAL